MVCQLVFNQIFPSFCEFSPLCGCITKNTCALLFTLVLLYNFEIYLEMQL